MFRLLGPHFSSLVLQHALLIPSPEDLDLGSTKDVSQQQNYKYTTVSHKIQVT